VALPGLTLSHIVKFQKRRPGAVIVLAAERFRRAAHSFPALKK
jgi:hypothetical protein